MGGSETTRWSSLYPFKENCTLALKCFISHLMVLTFWAWRWQTANEEKKPLALWEWLPWHALNQSLPVVKSRWPFGTCHKQPQWDGWIQEEEGGESEKRKISNVLFCAVLRCVFYLAVFDILVWHRRHVRRLREPSLHVEGVADNTEATVNLAANQSNATLLWWPTTVRAPQEKTDKDNMSGGECGKVGLVLVTTSRNRINAFSAPLVKISPNIAGQRP